MGETGAGDYGTLVRSGAIDVVILDSVGSAGAKIRN